MKILLFAVTSNGSVRFSPIKMLLFAVTCSVGFPHIFLGPY